MQGVSKRFANGTLALSEVDLEFSSGKKILVRGDNGAGKTTLLRLVATLITPSTGQVWIDQQETGANDRQLRKKIAWAPSLDHGFLDRLTGSENLDYFAALCGVDKNETQRVKSDWSELEAFKKAMSTPFYLCTTGMQQILNLARAWVQKPPLLIADEPLRGLSQETIQFLIPILLGKSHQSCLISSHQEFEDQQFDHIVSLEHGKITQIS